MKIAVTGLMSSGKSTAAKFLSKKKYPIYSADSEVAKLYKKKSFKKLLVKSFHLNNHKNLKKKIKKLIFDNKLNVKKLERITHPEVRQAMKKFFIQHKFKKFLICEVPLLVESKINKYFDIIIFIGASKSVRLKRHLKKGGSKRIFNILDKRQLSYKNKAKYCDFIIVNNYSLKILKKKILNIINYYE